MRKNSWLMVLLCCLALLPFNAYASPVFVNAANPKLPQKARGVPMGGALRVHSLNLEEEGNVTLELERFSVFAPNAKITTTDGKSEPIPDTSYFRGRLANDPNSVVMIKVPKNGKTVGIVNSKGKAWMLESDSNGLKNRKVDLENELSDYEFKCGTEDSSSLLSAQKMASSMDLAAEAGKEAAATAADVQYAARIIIDTDYAFRKQFSSNGKTNDYIADLIAYASIPYEREVKTKLLIQQIRLATKGNDPYKNKTDCDDHLEKVKSEWKNKSSSRTLVHLISAKILSNGKRCGKAAKIEGLCSKTNGYSVSLGITPSFDIDHPNPMWEGMVIAHEIGHIFGSYHPHRYCDIGGIDDPVDICGHDKDDTICPTPSKYELPGVNSLTGGSQGDGNGTLMSYCHNVSDNGHSNYANFSHTFGKNHPYGVAAYRVPNVMLGKVIEHASCMALPLPDFVTPQIKMFDLSGAERYTYKINEAGTVKAWIDNTGDADWEEGNTKDRIKVSFFLSKGENVDDDSKWVRLSQQNIQKANLRIDKNPKQESFVFDLEQLANSGYIAAGKYNIVACADYPNTKNNGIGDVREKSESNNCSKEAVFTVEPLFYPDLTAHSLQLNSGGTSLNGGSLYGLTVNVQNIDQGSADSSFQIRYEINGPSTGGLWQTVGEKSFTAVPFAAGADQQVSTNDSFAAAPAVEGDYLLRACVDSTQVVIESNEGNNCSGELSIYVGASSNPSLKPVYRFRDYAHSSYFYTASEDEKNLVIDKYSYLWTYQHIEHCALPTQESGYVPVYRFRADIPAGTFYFYTASEAEKDHVVADYPDLWKYQGVVWYAYDHEDSSMNTVPVHRFRADTASAVFYFYTASEAEKDYVIASYPDLWKYQGIAWYGFRCP